MSLHLNNTLPVPIIILIAIALVIPTIAIYRRHELPPPWKYWLPALRIIAILLVVVTLFQPVLVKTDKTTAKGKIAVLVDNSGSMSISDDYSLARKVELSAKLGLIPDDLRNKVFKQQKNRLDDLVTSYRTIAGKLDALQEAIRRRNQLEKKRISADLAPNFAAAVEEIQSVGETIDNSLTRFPYLDPALLKQVTQDLRSQNISGLYYRRWERVEGWEISALQQASRFRREADETALLPAFEMPRNIGSTFGAVAQGYIRPPLSGEYTFLLCTDDQGALFLSPDDTAGAKEQVCFSRIYSPYGKFDATPEQTSHPIQLEAGSDYYVEAVLKEQMGDDHLIVGWKRPDGKTEIPIPGNYLIPKGIITQGYEGPAYADLLPECTRLLAETAAELNSSSEWFSKLAQQSTPREEENWVHMLEKAVSKNIEHLRDTARTLEKLQLAADVQLAQSNQNLVDQALSRLKRMSRAEIARQLLTRKPHNLLHRLSQIGEPELYVLGDNVKKISSGQLGSLVNNLPRTNLGTCLKEILENNEDQLLSAILVLTDGNNNAGHDLREAKEIAEEREIPVFALGIGSKRPPKDVAIDTIIAPGTSFRNDTTRVTAILRRHGFENQPISLQIESGGEVVHTTTVPPGTEPRVTIDMSFTETRSGMLSYSVQTKVFTDEQVTSNNRKGFKTNVLKDPIRTLLIDEYPRWESRFCNLMLQRDKRFHLDTIFVGSLPDDEQAVDRWPDERLFDYQVLIVGDVSPEHFSTKQMERIRDFVSERGGSVLFLAGKNHMPKDYFTTPIAELLPLQEEDAAPPEPNKNASGKFVIRPTPEGQYDPMIQISATPVVSGILWEKLPRLDWVQASVTPTRAAEELIASRAHAPLLLKSSVGLGKVIYIGSDSFWRWRYKAKWQFHHRLWGQMLLWATLGRTTGSDDFVKMMVSRPVYSPGEPVEITARILNEAGLPYEHAQATVEISNQETKKVTRIVELRPVPKSGGKYITTVPDLPRGQYRAVPVVQELQEHQLRAGVSFEIRDNPTNEYVDLSLTPATLKQFATTNVPFDEASSLIPLVPKLQVPQFNRHEWEIWDSFYMLAAIASALIVEWILRKRNQLV